MDGLLKDATRPPGRKPLSARRIKQVVDLTLHEKPPNATHWSVRMGWTSRRAHVKALRGAAEDGRSHAAVRCARKENTTALLFHPPGRHHRIVQMGKGLWRSHRRSAKSLASMTE